MWANRKNFLSGLMCFYKYSVPKLGSHPGFDNTRFYVGLSCAGIGPTLEGVMKNRSSIPNLEQWILKYNVYI